jgi:hypothetical protein
MAAIEMAWRRKWRRQPAKQAASRQRINGGSYGESANGVINGIKCMLA